jgi:uncharacterized protein YjbI with pentapeptide repeats
MPDPSESQPSISVTAPLEAATSAPDPIGAASDLAELQGNAIIPLSEDAQLSNPHSNLDGIAAESTSAQNPDESDLLERAGQGEVEALRQLLNHDLAAHAAELADIEFRGERLQLSVSGREVPPQDAVEGLIKEWIVQLGLAQVQKVELYGQKEDCELPFWRSEFDPAELALTTPRQKPPEIKPVTFAFQKTDSTALNPVETAIDSPEKTVSAEQIEAKAEKPETVALEESFGQNANLSLDADMQSDPTKLIAALSDKVQSPSLSSLSLEQANEEMVATSPSDQTADLEQAKLEPKQIVENAATASKRKAVEAFLARYAAGERSFTKIDLSEADLSGINLTLADLQEAQLIWANLQEASLYHVNLLGAKLRHANLKGAKLRSANLRGADFLNADLSGTDLSWSNLTGANLTGANLTDANLKNAVLDNVIMPDGTRLD